MKLQYRPSLFQQQAVDAVCRIFQPSDWRASVSPDFMLCGAPYFTVELAIGVDKVYTYLRTIYELYYQHGWQKYIIVVPNLALHEQVIRILRDTAAHFAITYRTQAHFFSYDSSQPNNLQQFLREPHLSILVINARAFNVRSDGLRKIRDRLDAFESECPLDLLAQLQPVIILDEPQRILGDRHHANDTQQCLMDFNPLFLLGYASRHHDSYQPVFRLSIQEAHQHQVIKDLTWQEITATDEITLRRRQIRQTISTHLAREAELFAHGIKVLSLFFIDNVANFCIYEDTGEEPGLYVRIFEEEYTRAVAGFLSRTTNQDLRNYLQQFTPRQTYTSYFSINKLTNRIKNQLTESLYDINSPYSIIDHDYQKLISLDNPTRFIFTHSGLYEGWEIPNIFQICPLHRTTSDLRRQCEVNRGLPLCVNQFGMRQDGSVINQLTLIVDPDYAKFLQTLQ